MLVMTGTDVKGLLILSIRRPRAQWSQSASVGRVSGNWERPQMPSSGETGYASSEEAQRDGARQVPVGSSSPYSPGPHQAQGAEAPAGSDGKAAERAPCTDGYLRAQDRGFVQAPGSRPPPTRPPAPHVHASAHFLPSAGREQVAQKPHVRSFGHLYGAFDQRTAKKHTWPVPYLRLNAAGRCECSGT